jgi:hypothetical protein
MLFQKACPEELRDRIFKLVSVSKKSDFFKKSDFSGGVAIKKSDFFKKSDFSGGVAIKKSDFFKKSDF